LENPDAGGSSRGIDAIPNAGRTRGDIVNSFWQQWELANQQWNYTELMEWQNTDYLRQQHHVTEPQLSECRLQEKPDEDEKTGQAREEEATKDHRGSRR
jgi:hypothetical protein